MSLIELNSRIKMIEEKFNKFEDKSIKIIQYEEKKGTRLKINRHIETLRSHKVYTKISNMCNFSPRIKVK